MSANPHEAIMLSKRLKRSLAGAPDPRIPARAIHAALAAAPGWTKQQREAIRALGAWLDERPTTAALQARCDQLLRELSGETKRPRP